MACLHSTVYRQLLRLGRELDRSAVARSLLVAAPEQLYDRQQRAVVTLPTIDDASAEAVALIAAFNTGEFYAPSSARTRTAMQHCIDARSAPLKNDRVDVGFSALRLMGLAVAGGAALPGSRPPPAWAEGAGPRLRVGTTPRVGSLLVTHPCSCMNQPTLHHAVVRAQNLNRVPRRSTRERARATPEP